MHAEVDHERARLTLAVFDADAIAIALRNLRQQRQRAVVVAVVQVPALAVKGCIPAVRRVVGMVRALSRSPVALKAATLL